VPHPPKRPADGGLPLIWGALLILSATIFFSQILEYLETGRWSYMSMIEFFDLLTEDSEVPEGPTAPLLIRSVLSFVPAVPVFLAAAALALLQQLRRRKAGIDT
jgi:hypothetical protein